MAKAVTREGLLMDGNVKAKVPAIRFAGFDNLWHKSNLEEIAVVHSGRDYKHLSKGDIPVYGTGGYMLSVNHALSNEDAIGIGRKGTINKPYILKSPFWTVDTLFYVTPGYEYDLSFIYCQFQRINWSEKDESTGVPSLSKSTIEKTGFFVSETAEQQKIGGFFKQIDIDLERHKTRVDKLKGLKQAMLQKMFPQGDATVPEIRFQGFNSEWKSSKFGDLVLIQRGGSPRPIEAFITQKSNGINWVKIGDVSPGSRYINKTKEKIKPEGASSSRWVYKGDLILSNSMSFGRPYIMNIDGCIHDGWLLIRNEKNIFDLEFLLQLLSSENMLSQYRELASGGVVNNLNSELVQSTTIVYPEKDEQHKIGNYFRGLDELIALERVQLDKLKQIKQACLAGMFV